MTCGKWNFIMLWSKYDFVNVTCDNYNFAIVRCGQKGFVKTSDHDHEIFS